MKHLLLVLFSLLIGYSGQAQTAFHGSGEPNPNETETAAQRISIYPNPATDFIGLTDTEGVQSIWVYNMVGRPMKQFKAAANEKYPIGDLIPGMYLVQLLDVDQKVIATRRIRKI